MFEILENDFLTVKAKSSGAELVSVAAKADGAEFLWPADPSIWGRHAPVLFPLVGMVKNNQFRYRGRSYQLGQHGFARDAEFSLVEKSAALLVFELGETEATLARYPFRFRLTIRYQLQSSRVVVTYLVENPDSAPLYFSIGAHPGFVCPLGDDDSYFLEFEQEETAARWHVVDGLCGRPEEKYLDQSKTLALSESLFAHGALIFKGLQSTRIALKSHKHPHSVTVDFAGFPCLGIWSKPGPFVCIEPWYGLADAVDFDGDLSEKEGIIALAPQQVFTCQHSIDFR